jgi:hypothetical protein
MDTPDQPAGSEVGPLPVPPTPTPVKLTLRDLSRRGMNWTLELHSQHLALSNETDPQPYVFLRSNLSDKSITYFRGSRLIGFKNPKLSCRMDKEAARKLAEWFGPPTPADLAAEVRKQSSWIWIIGLLLILLATHSPGNPQLEFRPLPLVLGAVLLVIWGIGRLKPHPVLLLINCLWFLLCAATLAFRIYQGGSWYWSIMIVLNCFLALGAWVNYRNLSFQKSAVSN